MLYDAKYCIDHSFPYFRIFTFFSTNLLKMNLHEKLAFKENELSMIFIFIMNLIQLYIGNTKFMIHDFIRISIKDLESSINNF